MSVPDTTAPYWSRDVGDLSASLGSGSNGLTAARAAERLAVVGPNSVEDAQRLGPLRLLWRQVESPLVLILIFAAAISLGLSQWVDAAIILAIVLGCTLLGFFQEYRASTAVEELKKRLALTCRVVRDGVERTVPVDALVPGDVILLSAGNLIPADGRILEAKDFLVSEASMTGESFPVEKQPGVVPADAPLARRTNVVFLGASVRSGTAKVLVVETGRRTAFGAIAARLRAREPETDFARGVRQFGYLLIRVDGRHRPVRPDGESPAPPSGRRVAAVRGCARRRPLAGAVAGDRQRDPLGRRPGHEQAGRHRPPPGRDREPRQHGHPVHRQDRHADRRRRSFSATPPIRSGRSSDEVRQLAFLNAAFETGIDNPLDAAIVAAGEQAGLTTAGHAKIDEIPYDFLRRRLTIVVAEGGDAAASISSSPRARSRTCSRSARTWNATVSSAR